MNPFYPSNIPPPLLAEVPPHVLLKPQPFSNRTPIPPTHPANPVCIGSLNQEGCGWNHLKIHTRR